MDSQLEVFLKILPYFERQAFSKNDNFSIVYTATKHKHSGYFQIGSSFLLLLILFHILVPFFVQEKSDLNQEGQAIYLH